MSDELATEELSRLIEVLEDDVSRYESAEFWDQNHESRAALVSGLTALRLFLTRLDGSVGARYSSMPAEGTAADQRRGDTDD
ncbi:hypothetical protein ACFQL4_02765 [Halosimplex aquaticum]